MSAAAARRWLPLLGMPVLLALTLAITKMIHPPFGAFDIQSLALWLPNALILLAVAVAVVWLPVRQSRLGLLLYAIGSDRIAAFRSGVDVRTTRILAYALSGLFSAIGGIGLTMTTGIGAPLAGVYYTLSGLAAIVIGGVRSIRRVSGLWGGDDTAPPL